MGISITFYGYHKWDTIPQTKFSSQTSELWRKVHGQSCHSLSPTANSNSSDLGVQKPQTRINPQLCPIHSEKNGWYCTQYIAVWLMIPLNANPLVKKGLEPTLKWGIHRGLGEFRLTHGARTSLWSDLSLVQKLHEIATTDWLVIPIETYEKHNVFICVSRCSFDCWQIIKL